MFNVFNWFFLQSATSSFFRSQVNQLTDNTNLQTRWFIGSKILTWRKYYLTSPWIHTYTELAEKLLNAINLCNMMTKQVHQPAIASTTQPRLQQSQMLCQKVRQWCKMDVKSWYKITHRQIAEQTMYLRLMLGHYGVWMWIVACCRMAWHMHLRLISIIYWQ